MEEEENKIAEKLMAFKKKAANAFLILSLKKIITQIIQTGANIILARILFPEQWGLFALLLFFINIFSLFSDLGLNAALIQKNKNPTLRELRCVFSTQIILGVLGGILMLIFLPIFIYIYREQISSEFIPLFIISSLAPLAYNLKLIPHTLLERKLKFKLISVGDISEIFIQQFLTVSLAFFNFGFASFVWGLLIGRLIAALIFYYLAPWSIGFDFSFKLIKKYLPFGIPYQVNNFVGFASGSIAPIIVGGLSGTAALGLINWAGGVGAFPRFFAEILGKLIFPLASRAQKDKLLLEKTLERSIMIVSLSTFPVVSLVIVLAKPITYIIYTSRWADGITALYLFSLQSVFVVLGMIFSNFLLALGEVKTVRNINIFWVALQWVLTFPLVKLIGFNGYALAGLLSSLTFFIPLIEVKRFVKLDLFRYTLPFALMSLVSGGLVYLFVQRFPIQNFLELILTAGFGILIYFILVTIFEAKMVIKNVSYLYTMLFKKPF